MKKILLYIAGLLSILISTNVWAEPYNLKLSTISYPNSKVPVFAKASKKLADYNGSIIKSNNDTVYYYLELEPKFTEALPNSYSYTKDYYEILKNGNFTPEKLDRINTLAYYGYGYKDKYIDHSDKKWYGITQVMILQALYPEIVWNFIDNTTGKGGMYLEEVKEMNYLVENFRKISSFAYQNVDIPLGDTIEINDTNKVLYNFFIVNRLTNISLEKSDNTLFVTGKELGKIFVHFSNINNITTKPALLTSNIYQNIFIRGIGQNYPNFYFSITITGGKLNLQKIDNDTKKTSPQVAASFNDAEYEVYDQNNKTIGTIKTNEEGTGKLDLKYGKYSLKEIKPSKGYQKNSKIYNFEITENNKEINLNIYDNIMRSKVIIRNKTENKVQSSYKGESWFIIKNIDGEVIQKLITKDKKDVTAYLPCGKYTVYQTKTYKYYKINENKFEFEINNPGETIYIDILNKHITSNLDIYTIDEKTLKKLANIPIKVISKSTNITTYKAITNNNGHIKINNIPADKYCAYIDNTKKHNKQVCFEVNNEKSIKIILKTNSMIAVPNTLKYELKYIAIGFCIITIGIVAKIYENKKNNFK